MKYDKDTMNALQEAYKSVSEESEDDAMKYSDKKKLQRQKQLADKQKEAPEVKNKIVSFNKESYGKRIEEAIKMSRKEYNKTNKVSTPVELEQVDKKKEMEDKMKEVEDMRSLPTRMNLIKTKLRAMGLNMSHVLKGKELSEVIDYTLDEVTRYKKEKGYVVGGTKKPTSPKTPNPVLDKVTKSIYASGGKIMRSGSNQQKKVRGGPTGGGGKYLKMYQDKEQLKKDAEEMGYGSDTKAYVETRARYGSKENMKS